LKDGVDVEDNVGFIMEIHKNIAATPYYKEVIQNDPLIDKDVS
jgi:hypothetical protein